MSSTLAGQSSVRRVRQWVFFAAALLLIACSSTPKREAPAPSAAPAPGPTPPRPGGYYKDDGPADNTPANLDVMPDATPKLEPLHRFANRPYSVFGRDYVPATTLRPYKERGLASWYGRKFHNQKTSTGEMYDMFAMTAAHPTLPLPSYARVTNVVNSKSVIVRVNDRGPFHPGRVIDLSYAAAYRLGIAQNGSGEVMIESVLPASAPTTAVVIPLPPVAVTEAIPPKAIPVAQEAGGYVIQLGAFANYANAQAFVAHLANQTTTLRVEAKVHQAGGLFRVVIGPYSSRDEARRSADQLRDLVGLDGMVKTQ